MNEREQQILARRGGRQSRPGIEGRGTSRKLFLEFEHEAFGGLAAHSWDPHQARNVTGAQGVDEIGRLHAGEDGDRELGADSGDADQLLEEVVFHLGEEAEEGERILANVRVDAQASFRTLVREAIEGRHRDEHPVPDAAGIQDHFLRILANDTAVELGDHEAGMADLKSAAWQSATASASAASPAGPAVGSWSRRATISATWDFSARP